MQPLAGINHRSRPFIRFSKQSEESEISVADSEALACPAQYGTDKELLMGFAIELLKGNDLRMIEPSSPIKPLSATGNGAGKVTPRLVAEELMIAVSYGQDYAGALRRSVLYRGEPPTIALYYSLRLSNKNDPRAEPIIVELAIMPNAVERQLHIHHPSGSHIVRGTKPPKKWYPYLESATARLVEAFSTLISNAALTEGNFLQRRQGPTYTLYKTQFDKLSESPNMPDQHAIDVLTKNTDAALNALPVKRETIIQIQQHFPRYSVSQWESFFNSLLNGECFETAYKTAQIDLNHLMEYTILPEGGQLLLDSINQAIRYAFSQGKRLSVNIVASGACRYSRLVEELKAGRTLGAAAHLAKLRQDVALEILKTVPDASNLIGRPVIRTN